MHVRLAVAIVAALVVGVTSASAQTPWSGLYGGLNGGYGWSNASTTAAPFGTTASNDFSTMSTSTQMGGALVGAQLGYNWQISHVVLGMEGDVDATGINGAAQIGTRSLSGGAGSSDGFMAQKSVEWLASIRGRVGYGWDRSLAYVTGGVAWEGVQNRAMLSVDTAPGTFSQSAPGDFSATNAGWVIGAGYEWMVAPRWSLRSEYLHYGFPGSGTNQIFIPNCNVGPCGANVQDGSTNIDIVRVGVNYHLNGPDEAASAETAAWTPSWTGLYGGVNAGYGFSTASSTAQPLGARAGADFQAMSTNIPAQGAAFGVQAGYNWQIQSAVVGLEADFALSGLNGTGQAVTRSLLGPTTATDGFMIQRSVDWLASIRGRAGYSWGQGLIYGTGGVAFEYVRQTAMVGADVTTAAFSTTAAASFAAVNTGWVIGAGYEWMLAPSWTVRGEYLHYGFPGNPPGQAFFGNCAGTTCGASIYDGSASIDMFRVALNFLLN